MDQAYIEAHRAELGLPESTGESPEALRLLLAILATLAAAALAGWIGGGLYRQYAAQSLAHQVGMLETTRDPERFRRELQAILAQPAPRDDVESSFLMGTALQIAAERLPRRRFYLRAAREELRRARHLGTELPEAARYRLDIQLAGVLMELEEDRESLALMEPWLARLRAREAAGETTPAIPASELENNLAYLLAKSDDPAVRDPARALTLAFSVMDRDPKNRGEAAYLDTLAEAHYAAGDPVEALRVQRLALRAAKESPDPIYLHHFDKYQAALQHAQPDGPGETAKKAPAAGPAAKTAPHDPRDEAGDDAGDAAGDDATVGDPSPATRDAASDEAGGGGTR